jgi:hypothetical protein
MWLHVVLLGSIPVAIPALAARWWGRPGAARIVLALVLPLLVALASLAFGLHLCDRGVPVMQWVIPCVAMAIAIGCVGPAALRRWTAGVLAVISIALSLDFAGRVHDEDVVGSMDAWCTTARALWHTPLTGFYAAEAGECEDAR